MLRCGDKFYNRSTMGSLVPQQAHQFWSRRQKGTKRQIFSKINYLKNHFLGPWKLLSTWCEFIKSGLPIGQSRWHVKNLHFRLLCCRFNFRQRTFNRGWWSSRGHRCNHGKKKNLIFSKFKFAASCGAFFLSTDSSSSRKGFSRATGTTWSVRQLRKCVILTCLLTFRPHANSN